MPEIALPEPVAAMVADAKRSKAEAERVNIAAAALRRECARQLRASGMSAEDGAFIMGISRQRFYQLLEP